MKTLIINGSLRNENSRSMMVARKFVEGIVNSTDSQVEVIELSKVNADGLTVNGVMLPFRYTAETLNDRERKLYFGKKTDDFGFTGYYFTIDISFWDFMTELTKSVLLEHCLVLCQYLLNSFPRVVLA